MPYLICYDISDDRLRAKIVKHLIVFGLVRVQYSVYCGEVRESRYPKLMAAFQKEMATFAVPSDSILVFDLTKAQIKTCMVIGHNNLDREGLSGETHTMIF